MLNMLRNADEKLLCNPKAPNYMTFIHIEIMRSIYRVTYCSPAVTMTESRLVLSWPKEHSQTAAFVRFYSSIFIGLKEPKNE